VCLSVYLLAVLLPWCLCVLMLFFLVPLLVGCVPAGTWCYLSFSLAVLLPCIITNILLCCLSCWLAVVLPWCVTALVSVSLHNQSNTNPL